MFGAVLIEGAAPIGSLHDFLGLRFGPPDRMYCYTSSENRISGIFGYRGQAREVKCVFHLWAEATESLILADTSS